MNNFITTLKNLSAIILICGLLIPTQPHTMKYFMVDQDFESVKPDMSKDEVVDIVGLPSEVYGNDWYYYLWSQRDPGLIRSNEMDTVEEVVH